MIHLTPEIQERIVSALRVGVTFSQVHYYVGLSHWTLCRWIRLGQEGEEPFVGFALALNEAMEEAARRHLHGGPW